MLMISISAGEMRELRTRMLEFRFEFFINYCNSTSSYFAPNQAVLQFIIVAL